MVADIVIIICAMFIGFFTGMIVARLIEGPKPDPEPEPAPKTFTDESDDVEPDCDVVK